MIRWLRRVLGRPAERRPIRPVFDGTWVAIKPSGDVAFARHERAAWSLLLVESARRRRYLWGVHARWVADRRQRLDMRGVVCGYGCHVL